MIEHHPCDCTAYRHTGFNYILLADSKSFGGFQNDSGMIQNDSVIYACDTESDRKPNFMNAAFARLSAATDFFHSDKVIRLSAL
jgi:hypothetical protein